MPDAMVAVAQAAFSRMLAACGVPPALYDPAAPATALKEGTRLWHMGTVIPLARLIEHELSARLDAKVRLRFDSYPRDQMARSTVFAKTDGRRGDDGRQGAGDRGGCWRENERRRPARPLQRAGVSRRLPTPLPKREADADRRGRRSGTAARASGRESCPLPRSTLDSTCPSGRAPAVAGPSSRPCGAGCYALGASGGRANRRWRRREGGRAPCYNAAPSRDVRLVPGFAWWEGWWEGQSVARTKRVESMAYNCISTPPGSTIPAAEVARP